MKKDLVNAYKQVKKVNHLSYTDLEQLSGLSRSQLIQVLTKEGDRISIDKMVEGLHTLGIKITIKFEDRGYSDEL